MVTDGHLDAVMRIAISSESKIFQLCSNENVSNAAFFSAN